MRSSSSLHRSQSCFSVAARRDAWASNARSSAVSLPALGFKTTFVRFRQCIAPECRLPADELIDSLREQLRIAAGNLDEFPGIRAGSLESMGQLPIGIAVDLFENTLFSALSDEAEEHRQHS